MELKTEFPTMPALKKQINRIRDLEQLPVVIKVSGMSLFRRKNMIENHIPFIISNEQAYLPFMGTYLKAKCGMNERKIEQFRFSTQQLLLWYLYQNNRTAYITDASKECAFTAMTMTRATKELEETRVIKVKKEGVKKYLTCDYSKNELFDTIKQYMKSPVIAKGYLDIDSINEKMVPSGLTALSKKSLLKDDQIKTYAIMKKDFDKNLLQEELMNPDKQIKIEVWDYNPLQFSTDECADTISIALSLQEEQDERVEMMVEEMLEDLWEKIEW